MIEPNEAELMILETAKEKISQNQQLSQVEHVVLREYMTKVRVSFSALELKHETRTATKDDYIALEQFRQEISKYGGIV